MTDVNCLIESYEVLLGLNTGWHKTFIRLVSTVGDEIDAHQLVLYGQNYGAPGMNLEFTDSSQNLRVEIFVCGCCYVRLDTFTSDW
jgi:hypothetical protein